MSWHFSLALVEAFSRAKLSDGGLFAQLRSISSAGQSCNSDSVMALSIYSRSGTTYAPSPEQLGEDVLTSFLADFPVKTSVPPARKKGSQESAAGSGWRWRESFVKLNRALRSWKTRQASLLEDSTQFYPTWPRWGWMRDGECSALPMLEHDTDVRGSLSLPTVTASWARRGHGLSFNLDNLRMSASVTAMTHKISEKYGYRWPTPILEWMMMWPIGWSALTPLETDRFHQWLQEHGAC